MRRSKLVVPTLVAALIAVTLAGGAVYSGPQVTLRVWLSGPGYDRFLSDVIPQFERQNPGIRVEALTMDWTAYQQKILTAVVGGTPPDLISFYSVDVPPWAAQGVLAPLDGYIQRSDFDPVALANGMWDGKVYALPLGMKVRAFYYRKDFLREAGFSRPPASWDELRDYAEKLTRRDASGHITRVGFWVPTGHPYKTVQMWLAFLWSNGGEVFDAAGKQAAFNSSQGVESVEFLADLIRRYHVDEPGAIKVDNTDFIQGRVAMLVSNIVTRGLLQNAPQLKTDVGIALPPARKKRVIELSGEMIGMTQPSRNKEEATKLLAFLAENRDVVVKYNAVDDNIPGLRSALKSDYMNSNPWVRQFADLAKAGRPLPQYPKWPQAAAIITAALDEVYLKGRPGKEAFDAAAQKVNALLR